MTRAWCEGIGVEFGVGALKERGGSSACGYKGVIGTKLGLGYPGQNHEDEDS